MSNNSKPLTGLLSWERVDDLIQRIKSIGPWRIHSPLKGMEESFFVAEGGEAAAFLTEWSEEIKTRGNGAGWVYVHTPDSPSWVKVYDPLKCASCGTRTSKPWWEMELEDPGKNLAIDPPVRKKKSILDWIRGK
jgi:hypothetical protein